MPTPLSRFDPDGHWPQWLNDIASAARNLFDVATRALDRSASSFGNGLASIGAGLGSIGSQLSQFATSAGGSLATLAAEASSSIAEFWDRHGDQVKSTLTGVAVVGFYDAVDKPVLFVDAPGCPAGQVALEEFGLADAAIIARAEYP